ncbi:MAG: heavy metal translocating P-type ATPase, partial [Schaedlerella arabinosiphila]|nr:heavy metal translocating P-type ATPase [Schaedlerella arabinosiphila]
IVTEGDFPAVSAVLLVIAYLILGRHVLLTAGKNLAKGHVFDENFLMSIATLGAFAIQDYKEAVGVMLFYRVGELFEEIAVARSRSQIMDAVDLRPEVVSLVQGSEVQVIPAEQARPGDLLLVRPGDRIPLDGTIMEGESRIDTSPVTGEPVPVAAGIGDSVISGCVNTSGLLRIRVEKALEDSMVTKILDSVENAAASKPKIDRFITRFSRIYTPIVVALAAATAILPSLVTGDWQYWVYTALTFLVISCPCALVLSVPLAFFSGIGAGSKLGILFKGGIAIEALQNVKAVVMDKTGTVTEGNFELQRILPAKGFTEEQVLAMAGTCEQNSTHPIAASIMAAVQKQGITPWAPDSVKEIAGKGIEAAAEEGTLLCGSRSLLLDAGISTDDERAESGGTEVFLAVNGKYAGSLIIA